jgi:hypothetical protein
MYLDDPYDYMQHINRNDAENLKEPTSQQKNTKMSDLKRYQFFSSFLMQIFIYLLTNNF